MDAAERIRVKMRERARANRRAYFKRKFCAYCKAGKDLQMHHVNPAEKISNSIWTWAEKRRNAELEKCIVLCASCHKKVHYAMKKHGTFYAYKKGCRCEECRAVMAAQTRRYRARKRAEKGHA